MWLPRLKDCCHKTHYFMISSSMSKPHIWRQLKFVGERGDRVCIHRVYMICLGFLLSGEMSGGEGSKEINDDGIKCHAPPHGKCRLMNDK